MKITIDLTTKERDKLVDLTNEFGGEKKQLEEKKPSSGKWGKATIADDMMSCSFRIKDELIFDLIDILKALAPKMKSLFAFLEGFVPVVKSTFKSFSDKWFK